MLSGLHPTAPQAAGGHFIAAAEALPVIARGFVRYMRVPILLAIGYVRPAVIAVVLARALYAVLKTAPLPFRESLRRHPAIHIVVVSFPGPSPGQLRNSHFIAPHESLAVFVHQRRRNGRVAELRLIVGIGVAVALHVVPGFLQAIVIAAARGIIFKPAHAPAIPVLMRSRNNDNRRPLRGAPQMRGGLVVPMTECLLIDSADIVRQV